MSEGIDKAKFKKNATTILYASVCVVAAPAAVLIAGSVWVLGLAAGAILVGGALVPAASQLITNLKFRAFDAVLRGDPIAAAWGMHAEEGEELNKMHDLIEGQIAEVENLKLQLNKLTKQLGEEVDEERAEQIKEMETMVMYRLSQYNESVELHRQDGLQLRKDEARYNFDMSMKAGSKKIKMGNDWQTKFKRERIESHLLKARADSIASLRMAMAVKNFQEFKKAQTQGAIAERQVDAVEYDSTGHIVGKLNKVEILQPVRA